ncbi:REP-associated tyrosine transposase [Kinneretia aquatilis]|uniref:REP-associated tyrosine transposase n=1 Tax=Kinneretia aquatilis TaxID=2070761 RepID=UPI0014950906|nr:transposase [Paucibacter aquatile]WIV97163.1 transposase [Paucibacter aquatile]
MTRPLRIEFPGAVYHVTARGNRREPIFESDDDRALLLAIVGQTMKRFDAVIVAYCLMGNHYHWVLGTRLANLSALMQQLNGIYTQAFNRRHGKVGHVFQGRFKAILVDRDSYLLEVCRYVELNPVRAQMVPQPGDWPWSSYRAHCGLAPPLPWLDTAGLHAHLLGREPRSDQERALAASRYAELVEAARDLRLWEEGLRQQIYLGDEAFVERTLAEHERRPATSKASDIPRQQRSEPKSLQQWQHDYPDRAEALWMAHTRSGIKMTALAAELGLSVARVSQLIRKYEDLKFKV